jgi:hypothetical protein
MNLPSYIVLLLHPVVHHLLANISGSAALRETRLSAQLFNSYSLLSAALQSKKKSTVTALTMVIDYAPIPIISQ